MKLKNKLEEMKTKLLQNKKGQTEFENEYSDAQEETLAIIVFLVIVVVIGFLAMYFIKNFVLKG